MIFKIKSILFISFFLGHQSFADMKIVCSGMVGNSSEVPVELRISTYLNPSFEELYQVFVSFNDTETKLSVNMIKNRDNSGYSFFIPRVGPLKPNTLFAANEIYVYTNGAQSSLSYEWKYLGTGRCTQGYRLIPTLCEAIYAADGGFRKANLTCQVLQ